MPIKNKSLSVYGPRDMRGGKISNLINEAFMQGKGVVDERAQVITSLLIQYGKLSEMHKKGHITYKIDVSEEEEVSEVCKCMRDRVFHIKKSLDYLLYILKLDNDAIYENFKPFISDDVVNIKKLKEMSNQDLEEIEVMTPPFHPNCQSVCVPAYNIVYRKQNVLIKFFKRFSPIRNIKRKRV